MFIPEEEQMEPCQAYVSHRATSDSTDSYLLPSLQEIQPTSSVPGPKACGTHVISTIDKRHSFTCRVGDNKQLQIFFEVNKQNINLKGACSLFPKGL